jgi:rhamnosyltransferase
VKVSCVIVCYRPNVPKVLQLCQSLRADGSTVILVDNTERPALVERELPSGCELITLGLNTGIAHAQNVGVAAATAAGADVVAFFDQDSTIEPGFLLKLVSPLRLGTPDIVSPLYRDETSKVELPSVRVNRYGMARPVRRGDSSGPYSVDVVISSGTAATKEVFEVAGTFDEGLFIDFVDTEWCLRCRSKRIAIRVVPSAVMHHRIGSKSISLGVLTIFVHSPIRCYYQLRNCFHLFRKRHIPLLFAVKETVSVFVSRALLLLFVSDRSTYVKAYVRALRDGARGVTGGMPC